MRTRLESLFAAQQKLLRSSTLPQERQVVLDALQAQIPAPVLAHFLRLIAQGRKGVGLVQHGVCSGCHLRLPAGTGSLLAKSDDLHLCENCGCYLLLPADEVPLAGARTAPVATAVRRPRKTAQPVAA